MSQRPTDEDDSYEEFVPPDDRNVPSHEPDHAIDPDGARELAEIVTSTGSIAAPPPDSSSGDVAAPVVEPPALAPLPRFDPPAPDRLDPTIAFETGSRGNDDTTGPRLSAGLDEREHGADAQSRDAFLPDAPHALDQVHEAEPISSTGDARAPITESDSLAAMDRFSFAGASLLPSAVRTAPRRVIAVGGSKGGTGKTFLAANLGLYLAQLGRQVVLVDADLGGANLHTCLGVARPEHAADLSRGGRKGFDLTLGISQTSIPGLHLLSGAADVFGAANLKGAKKTRLLEQLHALPTDYVVIDLGAGTGFNVLDLFLAADIGVFLTLPEPTSLENTYRFLRAAFIRQIRRAVAETDDGEASDARQKQIDRIVGDLGGLPAPIDLVGAIERQMPDAAERAQRELDTFRPRIVVNQARLRADLELGDALRSAARRRLGIRVHYLGHIEYDDTVWLCMRRLRPLLIESPGTRASKNIERIARRVLAVDAGKDRHVEPSVPPGSHYDLLEVDRGATDEEIRRAYKRARDIYGPESHAVYGLFEPSELDALRTRIDEAYDVLLDPALRRPYDLSIFPDQDERAPNPESVSEVPVEDAIPPPIITPESEFTGALLRQVRESQRIDLRDVSARTKIGLSHLRAIEDDDFAALPAVVYARGFVQELAKYLRLDPDQVSKTYIRRYRRYLDA
ncbi:MAG: helix-turn-helix domain-containing protein, partial [Deltaproteobacteria bacterium]|nr:helix-turn-helix domain-containing protein [Deltaproteobacteria bacterium]